ncbi:uncharacterized protein LOC131155855 [Malania oleifera]|uniref:uncharacterized protein LOC131155855 n=1 Tax=Malania oleifera TaxID=397392 RepID=UPI0025AEAF03|nr:uncharacterized protein LOC131155855 [Malania oleifera]
MAHGDAQRLILMATTSILLIASTANPNWDWMVGSDYSDWSPPNRSPKKFIVGGVAKWAAGVNYTDWVIKNRPFYENDTLVFKYPPPGGKRKTGYSVYLFDSWDYWSFASCDIDTARMVANSTQGVGKGFQFKLTYPFGADMPALFGCGEGNGSHCRDGGMMLAVWPWPRRRPLQH